MLSEEYVLHLQLLVIETFTLHCFINHKSIQSKVIVCFQAKGHPLIVLFPQVIAIATITVSNYDYDIIPVISYRELKQNSNTFCLV